MTRVAALLLNILYTRNRSRFTVTSFALVLLLCSVFPLAGFEQADTETYRAVLEVVAKYQAFGTAGLDGRLGDLGYTPPFDRSVWDAFPAVRKIEEAVLAADRATPSGRQRVLALLSRALAQEYDAIRYEPALENYFSSDNVSEVSFSTARPSSPGFATVGQAERRAILVLAQYADESGAFGGTEGVLLSQFGLADDQAYAILRSSGSAAEALERGYAEVMRISSREVANARLSMFIRDMASVYSASTLEPDLAPFLGGMSNVNSPRSIALSSPVSANDALAATRASVADRYSDFQKKYYGQPGARAFNRMVARGGGFGGVVFGAGVHESSPDDAEVERVAWIPGEPAGWGRLLVVFGDSTTAYYGPARESDIRTALDLIQGVDGDVLRPGDGVGLVGLDNPRAHLSVEGTRIRSVGSRFDVVMHPALVDHPVGRSALMVDSLPINDGLLELVAGSVPEARNEVQGWLERLREGGTWKFTDRETWVKRVGSSMLIVTDRSGLEMTDGRFLSVVSFSGLDRYVHAWEFAGIEGEAVTFELESEDFDAYLYVTGPGLDAAVEDDDGAGGRNARIELVLPATGAYRVIASSFWSDEGGEYRLTAGAGIDADDDEDLGVEGLPTIGALQLGQARLGTLESGEVGQAWEFGGTGGEEVTFELESGELDAYLYVVGPGLDAPLTADDSAGGTNARLELVLPETGAYRVIASSFLGNGDGQYVLTARSGVSDGVRGDARLDGLETTGRRISADQIREETLEADEVGQAWEFAGIEGEAVTFELESQDFDAYLYVTGPGLDGAVEDDDGAGGRNARIELVLPATGAYRVIASRFWGDERGEYRLAVRAGIGGNDDEDLGVEGLPTIGALQLGQTRLGTLEFGEVGQAWEFGGTGGEEVTFELESGELDAYLYVVGPGLDAPLTADDSAGGTNARLELVLPETGAYRVIASSFLGNGDGQYVLTARSGVSDGVRGDARLDGLETTGRRISADQIREETLEADEVGQAWEFAGIEGEAVTFELESQDFDAYLYVTGPGLDAPIWDDDSADGTNARLELVPPVTGVYQIMASSFLGNGGGAYQLSSRLGTSVVQYRSPLESVPLESQVLRLGAPATGVLSQADARNLGGDGSGDSDFHAVFGTIRTASSDFDRLNDFAKTFAFVRWVASRSASWVGWPDQLTWTEADSKEERRISPQVLIVTESGFGSAASESGASHVLDVLAQMTTRSLDIGQVVQSELTTESYVWESRDSLVDVWRIRPVPGDELVVRLTTSAALDAWLWGVGPNLEVERVGPQNGQDYVELRLSASADGTHYIVVEDLSSTGGSYAVTATLEREESQ